MNRKQIFILLTCTLFLFSFAQLKSQSWVQLISATEENLLGVAAPTADICYVSGGTGTILKTIDGGNTWNFQQSGVNQVLYSICFTDTINDYAVGDNGSAIRTVDGGLNWRLMAVGGQDDNYRFIYFINATVGFVTGGISGGDGFIYKTTDAGDTWNLVLISDPDLLYGIYSVYFISDNLGFGHSWGGEIIKTTDGGDNWSYLSSVSTATTGTMIFFDENNGLLPGLNGTMQRTEDGGLNWFEEENNSSYELVGLDFFDENNGFSVGGNVDANTSKMLSTIDGGNNWLEVELEQNLSRLYRVDLVENTGYAVGLDGTIIKYNTIENNLFENPLILNSFCYPNPFNNYTIIDFKDQIFTGKIDFELLDISGKIIQKNNGINKEKFIFNRNNLPAGFYFYKIYNSAIVVGNGKFLIE